MIEQESKEEVRNPFLGEIETEIVGMQYHEANIDPGEQVNLEREPRTHGTGVPSEWITANSSRWVIYPRIWRLGWLRCSTGGKSIWTAMCQRIPWTSAKRLRAG